MNKSSIKGKRKPMRQIIVLKGEFPGATFTRKQAEEAVKSVEQEQKLARKRASRQAKFDKQKKQENNLL